MKKLTSEIKNDEKTLSNMGIVSFGKGVLKKDIELKKKKLEDLEKEEKENLETPTNEKKKENKNSFDPFMETIISTQKKVRGEEYEMGDIEKEFKKGFRDARINKNKDIEKEL